jgi:uncharacterized protein YjiS (DUF1127 family)
MSTQKLIQSGGLPYRLRQGLASAPMPLLKLLARLIVGFRRQRQRYDLATLDDRMLRDMGISRLEADRESHKPFWRD